MRAASVLLIGLCFLLVTAPPAGAEEDGIRALPVPAATILAGQVIAPQDLGERQFRTTPRSLSGIALDAAEIAGKETRRTLMAGRPIPLSALRKPLAVKRGDKVTATYEEAGLSISTQLTALEDGAVGDRIEARNVSSGLTLEAEVQGPGTLKVSSE